MGMNFLREVWLPDSIKIIDDYAFYNCVNLREISMPDCVISIGNFAFYNCVNLEYIEYSSSLKFIGESAKALKDVIIEEPNAVISDRAFSNCYNLKSVKLNPKIIRIGNGVFRDCPLINRENVELNNSMAKTMGVGIVKYFAPGGKIIHL